jgi:hypothetical protein
LAQIEPNSSQVRLTAALDRVTHRRNGELGRKSCMAGRLKSGAKMMSDTELFCVDVRALLQLRVKGTSQPIIISMEDDSNDSIDQFWGDEDLQSMCNFYEWFIAHET